MLAAGISSAVLVLYPLAFHMLVGLDSVAVVGLLWTIAMIIYDGRQRLAVSKDGAAHYGMGTAANVLIGACWGAGSLIHAASQKGMGREGARILLISLVLCVSFVMSTHSKGDNSKESVIVRTLQRSVLHVSVGLFISGILLSVSQT